MRPSMILTLPRMARTLGATPRSTTLASVPVERNGIGAIRTASGVSNGPSAPIPLRSTGTDANVVLRGVAPNVLAIRGNVKIIEGRMFRHGLSELVGGKNAKATYSGLTLGSAIDLGSRHYQVVGLFDAAASSF